MRSYLTQQMHLRTKTFARVLTAVVIAWLPGFAMGSGPSPVENKNSLLTASDLDGGAVTSVGGTSRSHRRTVNPAMLAALEANAQLRRVELYLKSGPAQNGDLRVVQAGKPDQIQK